MIEPSGRKHPIHQPVSERSNGPIILFVTICTKDKKPILANAAAHQVLRAAWIKADSCLVGRYVIMPDHLHFFCAPEPTVPRSSSNGSPLEVGGRSPLATSRTRTCLAAARLGHTIAAR
jgi:hypothetical protein